MEKSDDEQEIVVLNYQDEEAAHVRLRSVVTSHPDFTDRKILGKERFE